MLYNMAKENGTTYVYVTLEQSRNSLLRQMEKMGMRTEDAAEPSRPDLGLIRKNLRHAAGGES